MSEFFNAAFTHTKGKEGKYSNNPKDAGGETMWGITAVLARKMGYKGSMRLMPIEVARDIYESVFWIPLKAETIAVRSLPIAIELFDAAVNCPMNEVVTWLQRSLNVLNQEARLYHDLTVDGAMGAKTLNAYARYMDHRGRDGETVLLRMLNSLQGAYYVGRGEAREKNEEFMFGWFLNRVS